MDNYRVYREMESGLKKKKLKLSELKKKSVQIKADIETLEVKIEEDTTGLNMIFDYLISSK